MYCVCMISLNRNGQVAHKDQPWGDSIKNWGGNISTAWKFTGLMMAWLKNRFAGSSVLVELFKWGSLNLVLNCGLQVNFNVHLPGVLKQSHFFLSSKALLHSSYASPLWPFPTVLSLFTFSQGDGCSIWSINSLPDLPFLEKTLTNYWCFKVYRLL